MLIFFFSSIFSPLLRHHRDAAFLSIITRHFLRYADAIELIIFRRHCRQLIPYAITLLRCLFSLMLFDAIAAFRHSAITRCHYASPCHKRSVIASPADYCR